MNAPAAKSSVIGAGRKALENRYERKFKRGSLIFIEGEQSTEMFILRQGTVRILRQEGENAVELAQLGPGSVLGELSLLDHQPRGATAQVLDDVTATVIDEELLQRTLEKIPSWLSNIIHVVVNRLRNTMKRTSEDVVRVSVAGVIRILLLLKNSEGAQRDGLVTLPVKRVKELVFAAIGLGGLEVENVLLHLILKELIYIRKNNLGQEYLVLRDPAILDLYLAYLRTKQRGGALTGEQFSAKAVTLVGLILEAGEKNGTVVQGKLVRIGVAQVEIEMDRKGLGKNLDLDALDEVLAAKVVAKEQTATESTFGTHKRITLIYSKETLSRIRQLHQWLPIFKEDVKL